MYVSLTNRGSNGSEKPCERRKAAVSFKQEKVSFSRTPRLHMQQNRAKVCLSKQQDRWLPPAANKTALKTTAQAMATRIRTTPAKTWQFSPVKQRQHMEEMTSLWQQHTLAPPGPACFAKVSQAATFDVPLVAFLMQIINLL